MSGLYGRPTAAELVSAVADFLDGDVRAATSGRVNYHARVAANALRMVQRELSATTNQDLVTEFAVLGVTDEDNLAAAIRRGDMDDRPADALRCLRMLVGARLAVAHPGYQDD